MRPHLHWLAALIVCPVSGCQFPDYGLPDSPLPPSTSTSRSQCSASAKSLVHVANMASFELMSEFALVRSREVDMTPPSSALWRTSTSGAFEPVKIFESPLLRGYTWLGSDLLVVTSNGAADGEIWEIPFRGGGSPKRLVGGRAGIGRSPVARDGRLLWTESEKSPDGTWSASVLWMPIQGGPITVLDHLDAALEPAFLIDTDSDGVRVFTFDPAQRRYGALLWLDALLPYSEPITLIDPALGGFTSVAFGDAYSTFYASDRGIVRRHGSGEPATIDAPGAALSPSIAPSPGEASVFFLSKDEHRLLKASFGDAKPHVITDDVAPLSTIAADANCVYWINSAGNDLMTVRGAE